MQERTIGAAPEPGQHSSQQGAGADAGQMTVPASLISAVMDVDAAVDNGGLDLQEALARMHDELAHLIPGPADESGARAAAGAAPVSPEQSSSRS